MLIIRPTVNWFKR